MSLCWNEAASRSTLLKVMPKRVKSLRVAPQNSHHSSANMTTASSRMSCETKASAWVSSVATGSGECGSAGAAALGAASKR
jgi:hypothetical protein